MRKQIVSDTILHIAIPTPLYTHFDYLLPDDVDLPSLQTGVRVRVPWRKTEMIGVLLSVSQKAHVNIQKLKKAIEILDSEPLFSPSILSLIQFSSDYYHHPIGEVFAAALPTYLRQGRKPEYRHHTSEFEALPEVAHVLSDAQKNCVDQVLQQSGRFAPFLLFGVTGSGKTEVYLQIIDQILKENKQAMVLVPEIGLTPQIVSRFQRRFLVDLCVIHSGLTDKERNDAWLQARNGDAKIIIGTRSAIFTPLKNPGVIIVDEEHDQSFKQQEGFRYCARDLAVMRAQLEKIPVILGSATPSLESFHNVSLDRYQLLKLPERAGSAIHPVFHIFDLRKQSLKQGFSIILLERIEQHIQKQGQVLIFINRRGFAPSLICHLCGWVSSCHRCDANMTVHRDPLRLICHHCGAARSLDKTCGDCGDTHLFPLGSGTERVEEILEAHFKKTPIVRIDRDTTRKKGALEDKLQIIQSGEPCILVGTQMLAKGHHFPNVTLAVILNIDSGWFSSDFRGHERTAQMILQVSGRAGRVEKPGEVILQTYHPEHPLLKNIVALDYQSFAKAILKERELAGLPPYQSMALLRAESLQAETALQFLTAIKTLLSSTKNVYSLLGPIPAPMQKKAGKYRAQLLLLSNNRKGIKVGLNQLLQDMPKMKLKSRVRFSVDVDPQDMF